MSILKKKRATSTMLKKNSYKVTKRIFDIGVSSAAIVVVTPIIAAAAIAVKMEDSGSAFFKQKRSGKDNMPFEILKLRTMKTHQDPIYNKKTHDEYDSWTNGVPDNFVFKSDESNPNITKVGKFLRKYSIDELPQFFNVLKGDMSIVGPRPENVIITAKYNDYQMRRLEVKPGITGWAQINGRDNILHSEKMDYDIEYIENASILLDIKIFFLTILQVITGKDTY